MSRIDWSDEDDHPGQFALWNANCERSLRGKRGQSSLRELEAALLALPSKELHAGVFVEVSGQVCALGALAVKRKMDEGLSRGLALAACAALDPDISAEHGEALGVPRLAAWMIVAQNDIYNGPDRRHVRCEGPTPKEWMGAGYWRTFEALTPEDRYYNLLRWVREHLACVPEPTEEERAR